MKTCNKCHIEKSDSEFRKIGRVCRECRNIYERKLRKRPDLKEKHKIDQRTWRQKNKNRSAEITLKSWHKNKEKYNRVRRERYKDDLDYRQKKIESDRRYKESGRRNQMCRANPKHKERAAVWKKKNPDRVRKNFRKYKDRVWIEHERNQRKNLDDSYVLKVVKKSMNYIVKTKDIPKELIEIQRIKIFTHRKLKQVL